MTYPDDYVDDGRIWCYATIESEGSYTISYANGGPSSWTQVEIDGVVSSSILKTQTLAAGDHILKFTLSNPTVVPTGMFRNVNIYTEICFPDAITTLADYIFYPVSAHTKVYMNMTNITSIGAGVFKQAYVEIGDLYFPNLQTIGVSAFEQYYGAGTTEIKSLGNITAIPDSCFCNVAYKRRVIPATVTSIGTNGLLTWDYDKTIICYAETPPTVGSQWTYRPPQAIYVPSNCVAAYKSASGWSSYASVIYPIWEEKLININHMSLGDFRRRIMLGISKPKPLYPDPWVDDGKIWCYYNVTTTESATSLGNSVNRYAGLEIDGVSVTPTNSYTFSTTGEHLVKITVVNKYTNTFNGCKTLIRCYYPDGMALSNDDFQGCSNLTFFRFPSDITSVGQRTFYGCQKLEIKKLSLSTLTSLNTASFNGCRKIKKITDLGSITSIPGNYVFQDCKGLTDVILPDTITSIGMGAFDGCTSLSSFTVLATTPPSFGSYVFRNISNIPNIYVPSESVEAYKAASGWSSYSNKIQAIPE